MHRPNRTVLVCLALLWLISACTPGEIRGSGELKTDSRQLAGIERVALATFGDLMILQDTSLPPGSPATLSIEAESNLLRYLRTEVRDGQLTISLNDPNVRDRLRPTKPLRYRLTVAALSALELSGPGSISTGRLAAGQLAVTNDGRGLVVIDNLQAERLTVHLSGAGSARLAGQVDALQVTLDGEGDFQGQNLLSQAAEVVANGSGSALVNAVSTLDVQINGDGNVEVYGGPSLTQQINGAGQVIQK